VTTINIGIVAHVDAGKTSLTERILYETKVIDEIGRVDKGTTQTDSLDLEKRRGITIKASIVSFSVNTRKINLIDTPGHADFLAEVERSLSVLDGAILLISAVEGVQAQTKILLWALQKLHIPTVIFINKIDRSGAQSDELIQSVKSKLTQPIIPMYRTEHIGTKLATVTRNHLSDPGFLQACIEQLAPDDEQLLAAYVGGETITQAQVHAALTQQIREAKLSPVFFGSAITGAGVRELLSDLGEYFPSNTGLEDAALSGLVFKLHKEATGEKVAYIRVFSGSIRVKTSVEVHRRRYDGETETFTGKIQKLHLFWEGRTLQTESVGAGEFCKAWGLKEARIGDVVGEWSHQIKALHFATPRLETRIEARRRDQEHKLYQVLLELAEEDPLIFVLKDEVHQAIYLRIFGEVQKEVLEAILMEQYGLEVLFSESGIVCIEKPRGTGQAIDLIGEPDNPFLASVGIRVEPGAAGSGVSYTSASGALPPAFYRAIEETVGTTLAQGLYGWAVTDIQITISHTGQIPTTSAGDFRNLVPLVLMEALAQAGTDVYEPINRFELSVPMTALGTTLFKLSQLRAVYQPPILQDDTTFLLTGTIPMETSEKLRRDLPTFTEGEGAFLAQEAGFARIEGECPTRKRMDYNPLHRREYLAHIHHVW
jgi:ribosomal protection tetracycline resistance protein